jgi:hypothetical protein
VKQLNLAGLNQDGISKKQAGRGTVGFLRVGTPPNSCLSGQDNELLAAGKQMRQDGKSRQEETKDW